MRVSLREMMLVVVAVALGAALVVQGCQDAHMIESLWGENRELLEQNTQLQRDLDEARGEADGLELEVRELERRIKAAGLDGQGAP